jgi:hypothetical protein
MRHRSFYLGVPNQSLAHLVLIKVCQVLAVATFATFVHAKNLGLGRHVSALTDEELESIKNVSLAD